MDHPSIEPGYYVEDKWFGVKVHQAKAKARLLAVEYGRAVEVIYQAPDGELMVIAKFDPPPVPRGPKVYNPAAKVTTLRSYYEDLGNDSE